MSKPTLMNWITLIILGVIWGASFMGAKLALGDFGPMTVAAMRLSLGAVVLLGFAYASGRRLPAFDTPTNKRIWLHMTLMGLITNAIPFSLLNWGQLHVTSGFAGVTMAVVPLLVLPLSHFFIPGGEMNRQKVIGFLIGFVGMIILIGPDQILRASGASMEPIARVACVTAALCYGLGTINTRLCPPVSIMAFSAGGLLIGAIAIIPVALMIEGAPQWPSNIGLISTVFLGLFPTALATILLVSIINSAGPAFMSLVNYQVPIWAIVFGIIFLKEDLPTSFVGALALILFGLAVSQGANLKAMFIRRGNHE